MTIAYAVLIVLLAIVVWNWDKISISKASRLDAIEMRMMVALNMYESRGSLNVREQDKIVLDEFIMIAKEMKEGKL